MIGHHLHPDPRGSLRNGREFDQIGDQPKFGQPPADKPGETFTKSVGIERWFTFTDPETYRVTGIFEMELQAQTDTRAGRDVMWDELAVGDCLVTIVPKANTAASARPRWRSSVPAPSRERFHPTRDSRHGRFRDTAAARRTAG